MATEKPKIKQWDIKVGAIDHYKYWNPYRRVLDLKGDPQTFYGQDYYQAKYNKDGWIKTVTRFGADREEQETYHFLWSKSGARSEYKVEFHTTGNAQRLDKYLYADQLSYIRPGWIADVKSRKDGRPFEVSFTDKLGFTYFYYHFNYSMHKDDSMIAEVVESSYFDSNGEFVGRHLIFWERGAYLRMIQYFNTENRITQTIEFIHSLKDEETTRVITNGEGKELERRIIPFMQPDKYAYKLEWTGREIVDHGLLDVETVAIAMEFYKKTEIALKEANEKVRESKKKLEDAKKRANEAEKTLLKAKQNAQDLKQFKFEMDEAKKQATMAIESMLVAEKDANDARLKAAAAAVSVRRILGPRNMGTTKDCRRSNSLSEGLKPPSGPIRMAHGPGYGFARAVCGGGAPASSQNNRRRPWGQDSSTLFRERTECSSGTVSRRHCSAASAAVTPKRTRLTRSTTVRFVVIGKRALTPNSVVF